MLSLSERQLVDGAHRENVAPIPVRESFVCGKIDHVKVIRARGGGVKVDGLAERVGIKERKPVAEPTIQSELQTLIVARRGPPLERLSSPAERNVQRLASGSRARNSAGVDV